MSMYNSIIVYSLFVESMLLTPVELWLGSGEVAPPDPSHISSDQVND